MVLQRLESLLDRTDRQRVAAWDRLVEMGLPKRLSSIDWKVADGSAERVESHLLPEAKGATLVVVNGRYAPELSDLSHLPDSLVVLPMEEAVRRYATFLRGRLRQALKEERDPFALLNGALHQGGLFLYLPPGVTLNRPVQVVQLSSAGLSMPRLHLFVGRASEVSFVVSSICDAKETVWQSSLIDVAVEEGARVKLCTTHSESPSNWLFESVRATCKRDSHFSLVGVTDGSSSVRSDYRATLMGENSEVDLSGGWMVGEEREAHVAIHVEHAAPNCRSRQLFKGVLSGRARSSFDGKIYVHPVAQQTDAFQLNNNLLASDGAVAVSKPGLEIFADDVKASHGSTVGQLDKEQLHYFRSRGISDQEARRMLTFGFVREVVDAIPYPSIRREMGERFAKIALEG